MSQGKKPQGNKTQGSKTQGSKTQGGKARDFKSDDKKPRTFKSDDKKPRTFKSDDKKPRDFKSDDKKPRDFKSDDKKPRDFKSDDKKPRTFKSDDKKPRDFKSDDKKPRTFKSDDKKPRDFKSDDKKPRTFKSDDKKPRDFKSDDKKPRTFKSDDKKPRDFKSDDKKPRTFKSNDKKPRDFKEDDFKKYDFKPEPIKNEPSEIDPNLMTLEITDIGDEGEGVGRFEGLTVFVQGALPGDTVTCKMFEDKKSYVKARLIKVVKGSKNRIDPPCPVYGTCGGCQIQALHYDAQLKLKQNVVENALKRVGGFEDLKVQNILGMEDSFRYRNKGIYQVFKESIGFFKHNSHHVVDVNDCLLQDENNALIIEVIRKYMKDFKVEGYNSKSKTGTIKTIMIRKSEATGETMVVIVTSGSKLTMSKTLTKLITDAVPQVVSIIQSVHEGKSIKGLGESEKILFGKATIMDRIGNLDFEISAKSFYQVNAKQTERMYELVMDLAQLSGQETVYELYSGTGTISLFLAQKAKHVYGVESSEEAVKNAVENAERNHLTNVSFICGTAEEEFVTLYEQGHRADVVVVDPPRAGCDAKVIDTILAMSPERIVYVSCKPSTLARDLKRLCESGVYTVKHVQPVDVFGHTAHVECVIGLRRKESL